MNKTLKAILKSRRPKEKKIKALIKNEFKNVKPYKVSELRSNKQIRHWSNLNFDEAKRLS